MTTIKLKNGSGAPTAGDLVVAEPALDLTNKRLYTEDSGGTVIEVGTNPGTDVTFADNRKAVFGAGSDLQIYHDGTHSYVSDQGTGNLRVLAENFQVRNPANNEAMLIAIPDSGVTLYHDNSEKLATTATGIDVTGTVTADGLNLDGNIQGDTGQNMQVSAGAGAGDKLDLRAGDDVRIYVNGATAHKLSANFANNNDISFYEDTGTTAKLFWDASAESLGIGTTSSIDQKLTLVDTADVGIKMLKTGSGTGTIRTVGGGMAFGYDGGSGTTERMRIDSSGRVGIGTDSPVSPLHVDSGADGNIIHANGAVNAWDFILKGTNDGDVNSVLYELGMYRDDGATNPNTVLKFGRGTGAQNGFFAIDQNGSEAMRIDNNGVGIGTDSPAQPLHVDATGGTTAALFDNNGTNGDVVRVGKNGTDILKIRAEGTADVALDANGGAFIFKEGGAEAMRIDSSGNLLVGTTDSSIETSSSTEGVNILPDKINVARNAGVTANFNRISTDGNIVQFRKDGTTVGSINSWDQSGTSRIGFVNNDSNGLGIYRSNSTSVKIVPIKAGALDDGTAVDLGNTNARFQDIYATNGTIQTSDRNEKQDIEALSDAEQRVAVAAKGLLRKFRWIDSVEEKGDEARIHFGIIAQDLQDAFTAEGLDAGRYGMFINSTWTDEETGEERSRMGVRYSELLAFIIAAI